ncbi:pyrimidine reductase family protein [Streptomyces sp. NRRL B-1677]|uniref:Pyrimidine reductase family protein n=1 Tax=Streptomyces klenkii TaxID=1420899 RepID=A0A3B0BJQ4_9ACTN|nr:MULTISPECIES: pyrimidine reductase family protein [Streptomyces]MBF6045591.1 pyrimidine reductase family protein [Streptomyces sp. NRRL B-1677]RKN72654.1 pyrimidine reductase family protein [Streptomyces klenkii]
MRRLFPVPLPSSSSPAGSSDTSDSPDSSEDRTWELEELAEAYAYPEAVAAAGSGDGTGPRAWLRANMVSSLDGAAHHDGRSQPLSSATDMRVFGTLRGLADAVVVGAETVRQEGYRPARAREAFAARRAALGQGPAPVIAIVSAGLDLDFTLPLFREPLVPTIVLTGADAPAERVAAARAAGAEVLVAGEGRRVDPALVPQVLAARGLTRLLTEGGPRLLGQFAAAGVLDELCLTLAPLVAGGTATRIVNGPGMPVPERFVLASLLEEGGFLFSRYHRI